jgi:hypothetical protein
VLRANAPDNNSDPGFPVEVTRSSWLVKFGGTMQAGSALAAGVSSGSAIDLVSDLGVQERQSTLYGWLVIKPARKHRIVVEGTPVCALFDRLNS